MFLMSNKVLKRSLALGLTLAFLLMVTIGTGIVANAYTVSSLNTDFQSYSIGSTGGFVNTVAGSVSVQMDPSDSSNTNKVLKFSGANGNTATYTFSPFVTGNVHIVTARIYMKSTATVHSRLFQGYSGAIANGTRTGFLGVDGDIVSGKGRFLPSGNVFNTGIQLYYTAGNWYNVTMAFKSYLATPTYDLLIEGPGMTYNGSTVFQASKQNIAYQNAIATGHDLEYMRLTNTAVGTDGTDDILIDDVKVTSATSTEYTNATADSNAISLGTTTDLTQNLTLPVTGSVNSSPITWTSLDPSVISSDGTIHTHDTTQSTYLTATINGILVRKFAVSVKGKLGFSENFENQTLNSSPVVGSAAYAPGTYTNTSNLCTVVTDPTNSGNKLLQVPEGGSFTYTPTTALTGDVFVITAKYYTPATTGYMRTLTTYVNGTGNGNRATVGATGPDSRYNVNSTYLAKGLSSAGWYTTQTVLKPYLATPKADLSISGDGLVADLTTISNGQAVANDITYASDPTTLLTLNQVQGHTLKQITISTDPGKTPPSSTIYVDDISILIYSQADYAAMLAAKDALTLSSTSDLSSNLTLPSTAGAFSVTWKSSNTNIISDSGVINRTNTGNTFLTATINGVIQKRFYVSVTGIYYGASSGKLDTDGKTAIGNVYSISPTSTAPFTLIAAAYTDGGNTLNDVVLKDYNSNLTTGYNYIPIGTFTKNITGNTIKYFVWNSITGLQPLDNVPTEQVSSNPKVYLVSDSICANYTYSATTAPYPTVPGDLGTSYPQSSWGMKLGSYFNSNVTVDNRAIAGRSTKTFISDGRWEGGNTVDALSPIMSTLNQGDYVLLSLGHNDLVTGDPKGTTIAEYKTNLQRYIDNARSKKANIIFITPPPYYYPTSSSNALLERSTAMKEVAAANGITLLDLNARVFTELTTSIPNATAQSYYMLHDTVLGLVGATRLAAHPDSTVAAGGSDIVHFTDAGATYIANTIVSLLQASGSNLASFLK